MSSALRQRSGVVCLLVLVALSFGLSLWWDAAHVRWARSLSHEGSPPPAIQEDSPTGFIGGQRHFLATTQRGETYRWIADAQEILQGNVAREHYVADNAPRGRAQLLPTIYTGWLAGLAGIDHIVTGTSPAVAVEHVALWEPVLLHLLVLIVATITMWRRFGLSWGAFTAAFLALHPMVFSQHIPGALSMDAWALWASAYALADVLAPRQDRDGRAARLGVAPTLAVALAVALNPAFGFATVVIVTLAHATAAPARASGSFLRWSLVGGGVVCIAWLLTGVPLDPTVSELRYAHPVYALAWIGLGVGLHALHSDRKGNASRRRLGLLVLAAALILPLPFVQLKFGYWAWLHTSAELQRFASLEGSPIHANILLWLSTAPWAERLLILLPPLAAAVGLVLHARQGARGGPEASNAWIPTAVVACALIALSSIHVRWLVVVVVLALPVLASGWKALPTVLRWSGGIAGAFFLLAVAAWHRSLPSDFRSAAAPAALSAQDLEALVYRHFSHWLANQSAGRELRVLAPPALSDSLVFHGAARVLLSSAWESHPGHVAASRILSSPEATEAQAVIESVGMTHLVLASWDVVLPLLVKQPAEADRDTLHDRLNRWVLPRYLRPLPYRLPPTPGFAAESLAVFEVVPAQDEALALARLAEYFLEVERAEPAGLVAETLGQAYPHDLNAAMARAFVFESAGNRTAFGREVTRLVTSVIEDAHPADPDRRLLRAIVLAMGGRHDLARAELDQSMPLLSSDTLCMLTPRQTFQLRRLLQVYRLDFPDPELAGLARVRSAAYGP